MDSLRFGTLFRLDVTPREQALADPDQVTRSGKVNKAVTDAEKAKTGKFGNQSAFFIDGEFYSAAGDTTRRQLEQVETDFFASLPKLEQFVLEHADDEEQAADLLGADRLAEIKEEGAQQVKVWIEQTLRTEDCPVVKIDLNA